MTRLSCGRASGLSREAWTEIRGARESRPKKVVQESLLNQSSVAIRLIFRRNHDSGCHAVAGFDAQQADALRGARDFTDGVRLDADDFAVLADQHQLGGFVHL